MDNQKINYLARSILNFAQEKKCPYCGSKDLKPIDRKYMVTLLLQCNHCGFCYRYPKDDVTFLNNFYQKTYTVSNHLITEFPSDEELEKLKEKLFPDIRCFDGYIQSLFGRKVKVLDYGCSWGYNVFKLIQKGHDATGFELSVPRAAYGKEKVGVTIFTQTEQLPYNYDLIVSSHVIEHIGDLNTFFATCRDHLNTDGIFMAFCPNGNDEFRKRIPNDWHVNWGNLHPNYMTVEFFQYVFKDHPYIIMTEDWYYDNEQLSKWDGKSQVVGANKSGKEILVVAKPNIKI